MVSSGLRGGVGKGGVGKGGVARVQPVATI